MVMHVDQLKKYQRYSFDNWLAEPKIMGAIPTNGKSARQHVPKSAAAAKGIGGVPTTAEGAEERPRRSQSLPGQLRAENNGQSTDNVRSN